MTREERNLVTAAVDGSLPSAEEGRVRELLKRDAEAMELYAREALLHGELEWHYGALRQSQAALRRRAEVVEEFRRRRTRRISIASLGIAATGLLMFAGLGYLRESPEPVATLRFNEGAVSRLVRASESDGKSGIVPGDRLVLERGAVELVFPQGVRAVIEAPAGMNFTGGNALLMDHGIGFFEIERPEAEGFRLTLPRSEVVDLGTSFGIIAPEDGAAEIHLIDGRVTTQRRAGTFRRATDPRPGQAYREDDNTATGYSMIPFRDDRFPRQLPDRLDHVAIDFNRIDDDGAFAATGPLPARVREVIVNGGEIRRTPGRLGRAVSFDGSGSHLEIMGWSEYHHRPSGALSFWVRLQEARSERRYCLVSWGATTREDLGRWSVAVSPRREGAHLSIRGGMDREYHLSAASRLDYHTWHHLAFVFGPETDGRTRVRIFIDGIEQPDSMSVPVLPGPAADDALIIGTHHDPRLWQSHASRCDIDDLRIYRTAPDEEDIAILASGGDPAGGG